MNGVSDPDEDGNRIVLNLAGQPRSIKVHDKHAKTTGACPSK